MSQADWRNGFPMGNLTLVFPILFPALCNSSLSRPTNKIHIRPNKVSLPRAGSVIHLRVGISALSTWGLSSVMWVRPRPKQGRIYEPKAEARQRQVARGRGRRFIGFIMIWSLRYGYYDKDIMIWLLRNYSFNLFSPVGLYVESLIERLTFV